MTITLGVRLCAHAGCDTDFIESRVVENAINDVCSGEAGPAFMRHVVNARCAYHQWSIFHMHDMHCMYRYCWSNNILKIIEIFMHKLRKYYTHATCIQEKLYYTMFTYYITYYTTYNVQTSIVIYACMPCALPVIDTAHWCFAQVNSYYQHASVSFFYSILFEQFSLIWTVCPLSSKMLSNLHFKHCPLPPDWVGARLSPAIWGKHCWESHARRAGPCKGSSTEALLGEGQTGCWGFLKTSRVDAQN